MLWKWLMSGDQRMAAIMADERDDAADVGQRFRSEVAAASAYRGPELNRVAMEFNAPETVLISAARSAAATTPLSPTGRRWLMRTE